MPHVREKIKLSNDYTIQFLTINYITFETIMNNLKVSTCLLKLNISDKVVIIYTSLTATFAY